MEAPKGIGLDAPLGATDRGTLWRATREPGQQRIVRFIDQRLSDGQFKQALTVLRGRERPRMAPIVGHGYCGAHYYLEYEVSPDTRTLEERMAAAPHWRDRLLLLRQVCDVLPQWMESPVRPLGLTVRDIVLRRVGKQWVPWLLPCPPVRFDTPRDLLEVDRHVLATIAPEAIRGIPLDRRAQDWYALGTLAAQAVGCAPAGAAGDDAVTDQARNALLRPSAGASELPSLLESTPEAQALFRTVQRYRFADPQVRPRDAADLRAVIDAVTDVLALAADRRGHQPEQTVEMLCWLRPEDGERYLAGMLLAAEVCRSYGDARRGRELLDQVLEVAPGHLPAHRARADALFELVTAADAGPDAPESRELLADLDRIKGDPEAGADPYRRAAQLFLSWGDPARAADELYAAAEADPTDLESLRLYRHCWLALDEPDQAAEVAAIARHRIDRMVLAGLKSEREGRWWHERFDEPLS